MNKFVLIAGGAIILAATPSAAEATGTGSTGGAPNTGSGTSKGSLLSGTKALVAVNVGQTSSKSNSSLVGVKVGAKVASTARVAVVGNILGSSGKAHKPGGSTGGSTGNNGNSGNGNNNGGGGNNSGNHGNGNSGGNSGGGSGHGGGGSAGGGNSGGGNTGGGMGNGGSGNHGGGMGNGGSGNHGGGMNSGGNGAGNGHRWSSNYSRGLAIGAKVKADVKTGVKAGLKVGLGLGNDRRTTRGTQNSGSAPTRPGKALGLGLGAKLKVLAPVTASSSNRRHTSNLVSVSTLKPNTGLRLRTNLLSGYSKGPAKASHAPRTSNLTKGLKANVGAALKLKTGK
jgi:hypothetical protein